MPATPSNLRRLVLARPDRVGDVVITSSCFAPLRAALPGVEIHFAAQAQMAPLFHRHPVLASFIELSKNLSGPPRIEAVAAKLEKLAADCFVQLVPDEEIECAAARAKIPLRIGFSQRGAMWLTESVHSPKKRGGKHEGFYNFDLLELLGVSVPAKLQTWLTPDEAAVARLAQKLPRGIVAGKYAVLHVGAHAGKPRLAPEFFSAASRWLVKERGLRVLLIGAEPGDELVSKILAGAAEAKGSIHDFCGQTDLAEAAFLLRDAAVVFGRDSGPAHLAAAMGARTVTLMLEPERENSAQRWRPLGERSWVLEKPMERRWPESRARFARRNQAQYQPAEIVDALKMTLEK